MEFLNGATLQNGEMVQFVLKDASGKAVAGQNVTINYTTANGVETYKVITDAEGKGFLALKDEAAGKYEVTVTYDGNDQYNGCTAKLAFTIEEGAGEAAETTESNATASTVRYHNETTDSGASQGGSQAAQTYYDPELNVYYDANGIVIGGQNPGASIYDLRNNPPVVDEEGNLV